MPLIELRKHWVGFLTTGIVGGVVVGVFTVVGTMSRLETRQNEMSDRLDRIAAALPDVSVRIAQEEIHRPLEAAVLVARPIKTANGAWVSPIHLFTTDSKRRDTYLVPVDGPDDRTAAYLASGIVVTSDKSAITMSVASAYASQAHDPTPLPAWVQGESSYLLFIDSPLLKAIFDSNLRQTHPDTESSSTVMNVDLDDWIMLAAELTANAPVYTAAKH